ncbi:MAG: bifunctional molybdenum cofactor guanylyltransferase MobA/molybdopterin-guanine dinucleotide biosynthesis adaptor protein MobB [Candidatus Sericytochromatia bacterium]
MTNHSHKKSKYDFIFNSFEIAFCGYSNSGKTTLISKLIKELKNDYKIAYIKHDAHRFDIDHDGKDTNIMYSSGAETVFINDKEHNAIITKGEVDKFNISHIMSKFDFAFVEGYKNSPIPKIVLIDENKEILEKIKDNSLENVIAFVGGADFSPEELNSIFDNNNSKIQYFNRNDISSIKSFILELFNQKINKIPLYGLLLTGGKSSRMGHDKSKINYHGEPQFKYYYNLLNRYCEKTFLSCRDEQSSEFDLPTITDKFIDIGPMGGILSALTNYKNTAFFVLACDLPYVNDKTVENLISQRNPYKVATSYKNSDGLPEPLCSIYEPKSKLKLFEFLALNYSCPRKVLINSETKLIEQLSNNELDNINYPEEYEKVKEEFKSKV